MLEIIYHTGIIMYMYNVDHTMYTVFIVCEKSRNVDLEHGCKIGPMICSRLLTLLPYTSVCTFTYKQYTIFVYNFTTMAQVCYIPQFSHNVIYTNLGAFSPHYIV